MYDVALKVMEENHMLSLVSTAVHSTKEKGRLPVVVFDLDGCLFDNGPRTWSILQQFAEKSNNLDLKQALNELPCTHLPYLLSDTLKMINIDDQDFVKKAQKAWFDNFFNEDNQLKDIPIQSSVAFVNKLHQMGAMIVYLTGRDVPGMGVGCFKSLRDCGFPIGGIRSALVMKPTFEMPDLEFKREACAYITSLGEVVASFDNEPGNCNLFKEMWPAAVVGFCDTQHAPNPPELLEGITPYYNYSLN